MRVLDAPPRRRLVQPLRPLTVTAWRGRSDAEVWRSVFARIRASEFADQLGALRFEVRDGAVRLQGEAARRVDVARLLALVWSVPGVAGVHDELTFCGETPAELARPRCSQARMGSVRR